MDSHKAAKAVKPKRNMSLGLVSLLFLAPALVFYIAFELWPIIQTIWYSFYEWNGIDASTFIGVENYSRIQFVSATLVFGLAAFDCSLAISSSHTSLGVL